MGSCYSVLPRTACHVQFWLQKAQQARQKFQDLQQKPAERQESNTEYNTEVLSWTDLLSSEILHSMDKSKKHPAASLAGSDCLTRRTRPVKHWCISTVTAALPGLHFRLKHRELNLSNQISTHSAPSSEKKGIQIIIDLFPGHCFAMEEFNCSEKHPFGPVALHVEQRATLSIGK